MTIFQRAFLVSIFVVAFSSQAFAEINGRWACNFVFAGSNYPQDIEFIRNGNILSGFEYSSGTNNKFATVTGTVNGDSFSANFDYISSTYYADANGTVSGDTMSGTWENQTQSGTFSCTRSSFGTPTPVPSPIDTSGKRPTEMFLFCNRGGTNLDTATCTVSVADAVAPPLTAPTGLVNFTASGGFFPPTAQCLLLPREFSPGIGACEAKFSLPPAGFPIGVKFPIEAAYPGDSNFKPSATSHDLIKATCVSTSTAKPCPNSIGLTFEKYPQLIKDKLALIVGCGSNTATALLRGPSSAIAGCLVNGSFGFDFSSLLKSLNFNDIQTVSNQISEADAKRDAVLRALKDAHQLNQESFQRLLETHELIMKLQDDVLKAKLQLKNGQTNWDKYIKPDDTAPASNKNKGKRQAPDRLNSTVINVRLKSNTQKRITMKSRARLKKVIAVLRKTSIKSIPLTLNLKVKQKGVKATGLIKQNVDVALN